MVRQVCSKSKSHNLAAGVLGGWLDGLGVEGADLLLLDLLDVILKFIVLLLLIFQSLGQFLDCPFRLFFLLDPQPFDLLLLFFRGGSNLQSKYFRFSILFYNSTISLFWLFFFSLEIFFCRSSSSSSSRTSFSFCSMFAFTLLKSYSTTSTLAFFSASILS